MTFRVHLAGASSAAYLLRFAVMIADPPEAGLLVALPSHVVKVNLLEFCVWVWVSAAESLKVVFGAPVLPVDFPP